MTIFIHTYTYFRQSVPKNRGNLFENRIIHINIIFVSLAFINAFRMIHTSTAIIMCTKQEYFPLTIKTDIVKTELTHKGPQNSIILNY